MPRHFAPPTWATDFAPPWLAALSTPLLGFLAEEIDSVCLPWHNSSMHLARQCSLLCGLFPSYGLLPTPHPCPAALAVAYPEHPAK